MKHNGCAGKCTCYCWEVLVLWLKSFETAKNVHELKPTTLFFLETVTMPYFSMSLCCNGKNLSHFKLGVTGRGSHAVLLKDVCLEPRSILDD